MVLHLKSERPTFGLAAQLRVCSAAYAGSRSPAAQAVVMVAVAMLVEEVVGSGLCCGVTCVAALSCHTE